MEVTSVSYDSSDCHSLPLNLNCVNCAFMDINPRNVIPSCLMDEYIIYRILPLLRYETKYLFPILSQSDSPVQGEERNEF